MPYVLHYAGSNHLIGPKGLLIGRGGGCHVVVPRLIVSRRHCQVRLEDGEPVVFDLGSRQGTRVNGRRVGRRGRPLRNGDQLEVANAVLLVLEYAAGLPLRDIARVGSPLPVRGRPKNVSSSGIPDLAPLLRPHAVSDLIAPELRPERVALFKEEPTSELPDLGAAVQQARKSARLLGVRRSKNGRAALVDLLHSDVPPRELDQRFSEIPTLARRVSAEELEADAAPSTPPAEGELAPPSERPA